MQYAITVCRFNDDDEQEMLVDQYITADQAIDAIVFAQGLEAVDEVKAEEEQEADEVEEEAIAPTPAVAKAEKSSSGKRRACDQEAIKRDIASGKFTTKELMEKHDVSAATVSRVRGMLRPAQEVPAGSTPGETAYMAKRRERDAAPAPETNVQAEIKLAFVQGFGVSEISAMYPMVEMTELVRLKEEAIG